MTIPRPIKQALWIAGATSVFINVLVLASPIYMMQIYDRVLVSRSKGTLAMLTVITVIFVLANGLLDLIRARIMLRCAILAEHILGEQVFSKVVDFNNNANPAQQAELMRDVSTLRSYLCSQHLTAFFDTPWAAVFTLLVFAFSWVLGVITLAGMAVLVALAHLDEKLIYRRVTGAQEAMQKAAHFSQTAIRNAEITHALGLKEPLQRRWEVLTEAALGLFKQATDAGGLVSGLTKTVRAMIQITMLGTGAYLVIGDNLPPGIMIASTIIVYRAIGPLESIISGWRGFIEARNAFARVSRAIGAKQHASAIRLPAITGHVEVANASFGYVAGTPLIKSASLTIAPGEIVGFIGPSGSGKSTLGRMLIGLTPPLQGRVTMSGYDVNQYDRNQLGRQIGYLPQGGMLFGGSIADNICRMEDSLSRSSDEMLRVAAQVGLADIVGRMPNGFETIVAEGGSNLSGGQKQLIGLARALYGNPKIVLLDEPDSNLDDESTDKLLSVLDDYRSNRRTTFVVISHSPKIIDRMDRLFLLKDGNVLPLVRQLSGNVSSLARS